MRRPLRAAVLGFLLSLAFAPAHAEPAGIARTEAIAGELTARGYDITLQPLVPAAGNAFPQNIIVRFAPKATVPQEIKSTVFALTQDCALANREFVLRLLESLSDLELSDEVLVLLSADDDETVLLRSRTSIGGTEVYTPGIEDEDNTCAVVYSEGSVFAAIPGADSRVSPLWLSQACVQAGQALTERPDFPGNLMLLYRHGLMNGSERLSLFLAEDVPAIEVSAPPSQETALYLAGIARAVQDMRSDQWDIHYAATQAGDLTLWTNEILFVLGHMAAVIFMIFTLAFSNFAASSTNMALVKDMKRTWFMLPATILAAALLLELFQTVFRGMQSPVTLFAVKVLLTCTVMQALLCVQMQARFRLSYSVIGYEAAVIAAICLILFSFVDISLVFAFAMVYAVALVSRKFKRPAPLIIALLLSLLPFAPYFVRLIVNADTEALVLFARSTFGANVFLACVLFIILSYWMRIVISLRIFVQDEQRPGKKAVRIAVTSAVSAAVLCLVILSPVIALVPRRHTEAGARQLTILTGGAHEDDITASYEQSSFRGISARHILIHSDTTVFRYEISLTSGDGTIPLYESDYEYILDGTGQARFRLPDWPESDLEILYSADGNSTSEITVDAYIPVSDGTYERVTKKLTGGT